MLEWVIIAMAILLLLGPRRTRIALIPTVILILALLALYFRALISVWEFVIIAVAVLIALGVTSLAGS